MPGADRVSSDREQTLSLGIGRGACLLMALHRWNSHLSAWPLIAVPLPCFDWVWRVDV